MPQTISKLHTALLEWMHYDPDTGIFTWLKHRGKGVAGMRAGGLWSNGYRWLQFYGISASESHWAVFYMTGAWPVDQVDHRDRNPTNNSWNNLRESTHSQNQHNRGPHRDNKCGVKGVSWRPEKNRWRATIAVDGRKIELGLHRDFETACRVRAAASARYHGEFAI